MAFDSGRPRDFIKVRNYDDKFGLEAQNLQDCYIELHNVVDLKPDSQRIPIYQFRTVDFMQRTRAMGRVRATVMHFPESGVSKLVPMAGRRNLPKLC